MDVITGIVESPRKDGRFVLQVAGKSFATVSLDILERLRLAVGGELSPELAARIGEEAAALGAYDRALNMLAFQARSARDLRRRLVQKGEDPAHVDTAIERLVANGLLDDASFARQFARSRVAGQGASKRRLQQDLFKRGVGREVADEAIAEVLTDEGVDEGEVVERVARKKARSLAKLDAPTRRRRLYAFLARRGYEADAIRRAMAAVLDRGETDELDDELAAGGGGEG
ncbi:MAG TPA: regulatory protein RecX [Gemmatimonadaceae bacterium]|nr:regulatory protein RecX [Gemmatimonadaceae bacterium]